MNVKEILQLLQEDMGVAVVATVDATGKPHARHVHIGLANEKGIFFMTSPKTNFYQQLKECPFVAITSMMQEGYLIQVVRVEGQVRELGRERLVELLEGNSFIDMVYPTQEELESVRVFQLYEGDGFYHSLTQGHKYVFRIYDQQGDAPARALT